MIDILLNNLDSVAVVIIFIVVVIVMLKRGAVKQVNTMLFYLVTEAEKAFGGGTGELKYAAVTTWLYEQLPTILTILFTDKQIDLMIEDAVDEMKKYLEQNSQARVLLSLIHI